MKKSDKLKTTPKSGRRRFIPAGSAVLLAGAGAASAQQQNRLRSDCDGFGNLEGKNAETANSDSDSGTSADRTGCGTKKRVPITYKKESKTNTQKLVFRKSVV